MISPVCGPNTARRLRNISMSNGVSWLGLVRELLHVQWRVVRSQPDARQAHRRFEALSRVDGLLSGRRDRSGHSESQISRWCACAGLPTLRDLAVRPPNPSLPARNLADVELAAMLNGNRAAPRYAVAERECCWRGISCVDSQISPHYAHPGVTIDERLCYRHKE